MRAKWQFSITFDPRNAPGPYSIGFRAGHSEDVDAFGSLVNVPVLKNDASPSRLLRVELSEDDSRLQLLLERVESTYGWKPSKWFNIPIQERTRYFGVRKPFIVGTPVSVSMELEARAENGGLTTSSKRRSL